MADEDVKITISQKGTIPVYTRTKLGGQTVVQHDTTLKGNGTNSAPLGISDEVMEMIEEAGKVDDVQLNGVSVVVDKIANIEPEAIDVAYENSQYPEMHNLQDAMDKLLYVTPTVSISVDGGGVYEMGSVVSSTKLNWRWNKMPVSQSLNQGIGSLDPTLRTYTYTTPVSSNITFTITGTDGTTSKSASASVTFNRYAYTKVLHSAETPTSDCVKQSVLSTFASSGATFTYITGDYIYFYTIGTGRTVQTNVLGQWADVATTYIGKVNLTQSNGVVFEYDCYRIGPFIDGGTNKYRV